MIRQRAVSALYSANRPHIGTAAVRHKKRGVNRPVLPVNTSAIQIEFKQQPSELTRNSSKCTFEFRAEILSLSRKSLYYCRLSLFSPCSTVYISILCPYHAFRFRTSHRILRFGDALPFADSSLPITLPLPGSRNRIMRTAGPPVRQPANLQQKNDPNNVLLFSDIRQPAPRQAGKTVTGQDHALRLPRTALP